jgi:ATP-dependent DNA ligase
MKNFAQEWKKKVNFRIIGYDDFVSLPITKSFFLEKVDGLLGVLIYKEGEKPFFQTTTGKQVTDIPVLDEYERTFKYKNIKEAMIPGELVGRRGRENLPFNMTQSVVKTFYVESNKNLIYHFPYDIISINNSKPKFPQAIMYLSRLAAGMPHVIVPTYRYGGLEDFRSLFNLVKDKEGFDGVVAREVGGKDYKVKFLNTVDLAIIGIGEIGMRAWAKGQASYLLTAFIDRNGLFRVSSKVGTGFTFSKRADFFKYAEDHGLYKDGGVIYVPPKLVCEISFLRSRVSLTPCYSYVGERYNFIDKRESVTLAELSFQRLRADKRPTKYDVRLEQIPEWRY